VVDGLTGQDAVNVATEFDGKVGISGVVLTRMDGDGRGGAALSMRAVTGKPIRFVGLGEKMDAIEPFEAERVAGRILGMGDIVALVEKAQETFEAEQAERMAKRFAKGLFNMNDLRMQLEQMLKMGGMQGLMGMMPGMGKHQARRPRPGSTTACCAADRADQFDDQEGTRQSRSFAGQPQEADRGGGRAGGGRSEPPAEAAQADGRDDEEDGQGRHDEAGMIKPADGQGRHARPVSKMTPEQMAEAAKGMRQGMGGMSGLGGGGPCMGGLARGVTLPAGLSGLMKKK
jgi:signal recognition particle subunit SRP54